MLVNYSPVPFNSWSPDGRELFYRNGDASMVVPVETDPTFSPGNPEILYQGISYDFSLPNIITLTPWDIHPDGDRFLMIKPSGTTADESATEEPRKIIIVQNWFEELKERVPVD